MLSGFIWIDIIFIILFLGAAYKGSQRGVASQLFSVAAYLMTIYAGVGYYALVSEAIFGFLFQSWAKPLSFFVIVFFFILVARLIERLFSVMDQDDQAGVERIGGMLVGAFRGGMLIGLIGLQLLLVPVDRVQQIPARGSAICFYFVKMDLGLYSWMRRIVDLKTATVEDQEKLLKVHDRRD